MFIETRLEDRTSPSPNAHTTAKKSLSQGVVSKFGSLAQSLRDRLGNTFPYDSSRRTLLKTGAVIGGAYLAERTGLSALPREIRADAEAREIPDFKEVRSYIAGFPQPEDYSNRLFFDLNTNAKVILSPFQLNQDIDYNLYIANLLRPLSQLLNPNSVVVVDDNGGSFILNHSDSELEYDAYGLLKIHYLDPNTHKLAEVPTRVPRLKPRWSDDLGLVFTLWGHTVTHQFDPTVNQWVEFPEYVPLGTAKQRVEMNLRDLQARYRSDGIFFPVGLDPKEVDRFAATGELKGYQTFIILPNSKGEPAIIVVTSEQFGLRKDGFPNRTGSNIEPLEKAIRRLNEIDPQIIELLTNQYGLRAISGEYSKTGFHYTYDMSRGIVEINEVRVPSQASPAALMTALLLEARAQIYEQNPSWLEKFDSANVGIDKAKWVDFLKEMYSRSNKLTDLEIRTMNSNIKDVIIDYS